MRKKEVVGQGRGGLGAGRERRDHAGLIRKFTEEAAGVDVDAFENEVDLFHGLIRVQRPIDNAEIFFAVFDLSEDEVEEGSRVGKFAEKQAKVIAIEFAPKSDAFEMFRPTRPEIAPPMQSDPFIPGVFAEIVPCFLAFDPLEHVRLKENVFKETIRTRHVHHGNAALSSRLWAAADVQ